MAMVISYDHINSPLGPSDWLSTTANNEHQLMRFTSISQWPEQLEIYSGVLTACNFKLVNDDQMVWVIEIGSSRLKWIVEIQFHSWRSPDSHLHAVDKLENR
ncbi:hypothetical protein OIU84_013498 [Salix udensis]|uniref:Uncharacterized protein n=1 Tax=Salix udensis TaxID=889485 RepID=A0AAD6JI45_9ROSI|nr:hypothetical protein OIU84_013498 [Salix udensis]